MYLSTDEIVNFYMKSNLDELINIRDYLRGVEGYLSGEGEEAGVLCGIEMMFELLNIPSDHVGDFLGLDHFINKRRNFNYYPYININEIISKRNHLT